MSTDNVTSIRPGIAPPAAVESAEIPGIGETLEDLERRRTGYSGTIQGGTLDEALDEQRQVLWDAQAIVQVVAQALEEQFGEELAQIGVPQYPRALRQAVDLLEKATGALEAGVLEDRALAISRARDARAT